MTFENVISILICFNLLSFNLFIIMNITSICTHDSRIKHQDLVKMKAKIDELSKNFLFFEGIRGKSMNNAFLAPYTFIFFGIYLLCLKMFKLTPYTIQNMTLSHFLMVVATVVIYHSNIILYPCNIIIYPPT